MKSQDHINSYNNYNTMKSHDHMSTHYLNPGFRSNSKKFGITNERNNNVERTNKNKVSKENMFRTGGFQRQALNTTRNQSNNPVEVKATKMSSQEGIVECISTLMNRLTTDELLYIRDYIDNKISKY